MPVDPSMQRNLGSHPGAADLLVAALAHFGVGLQGFSLALVGLLAQGMALLKDAEVELELLLALLLPALEPATSGGCEILGY